MPGDVYAHIAYVGVIVQSASALLLAALFVALRRFAGRRPYLRDWSIAFLGLTVAIGALAVHYTMWWFSDGSYSLNDGRDPLARTCYLLYQAGKLAFFGALVTGAARFAGRALPLGRRPLIALLAAYAVVSVVVAVDLDAIVRWQTPVGIASAAAAALLLFTAPKEIRSLGTRITASVCLLLAALWACYARSFDFDRTPGVLEPLLVVITRYNSLLDVVVQGLLSVGMVIALFQDLEREAESARAARAGLQTRLAESRHLESLGVVVSGVAHDLNNPLTVILGYSEELIEPSWSTHRATDAARVIHEQAQRCRSIVRDLLSFSRPRPPVREPIAPAELIERVVRGFVPLARRAAVGIEVVVEPGLAPVPADPTGLEQVLTNLVENALHASPRGTSVRVSARDRDGACEIFVEDEGAGIPRDLASRIFEPFFTTKAAGKGTGLGLAVSRRIVTAHGGTIALEPRPDRCGSRFVVKLPRTADARPSDASAPLPPHEPRVNGAAAASPGGLTRSAANGA